jgi:hypothetical protein
MSTAGQWKNVWGTGLFKRGPNAFVLASVVSGFAWYFARQQVSDFNAKQSELIRRVEQDETAENCTFLPTQSRKPSTTTTLRAGTARRLISMVSSEMADSSSSAAAESRKVIWCLPPSSSTARVTRPTSRRITKEFT